MVRLDYYEKQILRNLLGNYYTINKISINTSFSWVTVKKKLEQLLKKGYVEKINLGLNIYCVIDLEKQ